MIPLCVVVDDWMKIVSGRDFRAAIGHTEVLSILLFNADDYTHHQANRRYVNLLFTILQGPL